MSDCQPALWRHYTTAAVYDHALATSCLPVCPSVSLLIYLSLLPPFVRWPPGGLLTLEMFLNAKVFPGSAEPCLQLFCPFLRKLQFLQWMIYHCFVSDASFFNHQQKSVGWGLFIINDHFIWHFHIWQISTDKRKLICNYSCSSTEGGVAKL